jgi:hypothetical protein
MHPYLIELHCYGGICWTISLLAAYAVALLIWML